MYAGSAALLKASGFLLSLWMARSLEVSEYGDWGLFFAVQTGIATFGLVGIFEAVVGLLRQCKREDDRCKLFAATNRVFIFTIGVTLSVAIFAGLFAYGREIDVFTFASILLSGALLAYSSLQAQLIRLEERHLASLSFSFAVPAAALVGSGIFFWVQHTAESFFIGSFAGMLVSVLALWSAGILRINCSTDADNYQLMVFVRLLPYVAITFFGWMSGYGNNLVITKLFDNAEVARFTFAMSIGAIMQLIASALNQVWSPRFFSIVHTENFDKVEEKNRKFFFIQSIVLGGVSMLGIIILPLLLILIGGNLIYYSSMETEFFLIFSGYIILIPWWHCNNYFMAYDRGRSVMKIVLTTSSVGIALWIVLMWLFGAPGIYVGFFTQMLLRSLGITLVARRLWPVRISWVAPFVGIFLAGAGLFISKI